MFCCIINTLCLGLGHNRIEISNLSNIMFCLITLVFKLHFGKLGKVYHMLRHGLLQSFYSLYYFTLY